MMNGTLNIESGYDKGGGTKVYIEIDLEVVSGGGARPAQKFHVESQPPARAEAAATADYPTVLVA